MPGYPESVPFTPQDAPFWAAYYSDLANLTKSYAIPGHKTRRELVGDVVVGDRPVSLANRTDVPSFALMRVAENLAAAAWSADHCRFSVNGSSAANQAAICSIAGPGDTVIAARALHKSLLFGLIYAGVTPVWLTTHTDHSGFPAPISPEDVRETIARTPQAKAVIIGSPSYVGVLSDVEAIADICHAAGLPLVVDSAWGGHFGFHPNLPRGPIASGADIAIISAHKTLPTLTQGALLLARQGRIDMPRLNRCFDGSQTTSPSAAIIASIDGARAYMQTIGQNRLSDLISSVAAARVRLARHPLLDVVSGEHIDPLKLVVTTLSPLEGSAIERGLNLIGLEVEMADRFTLIPQITVADSPDEIYSLVEAITSLADRVATSGTAPLADAPSASLWGISPVARMTPRDAFFSKMTPVSADKSIGRISGELVAPYPPGIPVLAPGEEITEQVLLSLEDAKRRGVTIAYAADPTLSTFLVVDG